MDTCPENVRVETEKRMKETEQNKSAVRDGQIIRVSAVGILANILLAAFKAGVGILSNSIAIVLDAVNNISDVASSVITIIGTRLAGKEADKKHPFGYGRIEYLSALLISGIVLYAGLTSLVESGKKIFMPEQADYSTVSLIIVAAAVVVKIALGLYVKKNGEKLNSDALVNSGKDALMDSVISFSTLAAALIRVAAGWSVEAWLGVVISLLIVKAGLEMLLETVSHLLGEPGDIQLLKDIKASVNSFPEVKGAYDLILHDYGPDQYNGSIHIEVEDHFTMDGLDALSRKITAGVYAKHHVLLTAVGIYSVNTRDREIMELREEMRKFVLGFEHVKQIHGFYYDREESSVRFDVVISFSAPSRSEVFRKVREGLEERYPEMHFSLAMDMDYGEL